MRQQARLTEESLFDFLAATKLPLVSSLVTVVTWLALALGSASAAWGVFALLRWDGGFWNAALPWAGAFPALISAPFQLLAWSFARRRRMQAAALALFAACYLLSILATWPRGAFCPTWYVQPFLAMLATCCLGVVPGLLLTLVAVLTLLAAPLAGDAVVADLQFTLWAHGTSLAAVTLASALTGALMHKLLLAALLAVEAQRRHNLEHARALRHRERLLRHAMRVETVGDLAGLVTHQLRNAFQVMLGHVTLGTTTDDDDRARRLALVGDELGNSRFLLDQLMSLAHPEEGSLEQRDLDADARAFAGRAARIMPASIRLTFESSGSGLPVMLNTRGLEHALWNLVINARHAMPEGGAITVRTGQQAGCAWLKVDDTGCGIPESIRERVFDPYFTTKPPGQGTGLGLAAVQRFMRSSNGEVRLESEVGRGTSVALVFPLASKAARSSA